jgi:hypothetical protein
MVFIRGGTQETPVTSFFPTRSRKSRARTRCCCPTHNRQLNAYGYLKLGAAGGDEFAMSANLRMSDIVALLEWICAPITTSGGAPENQPSSLNRAVAGCTAQVLYFAMRRSIRRCWPRGLYRRGRRREQHRRWSGGKRLGHGFRKKPAMECTGGGTGEVYAWAIENPDKDT